MSPTLTKMLMDERIRETTKRATRAALLERPARHGKRAFARWSRPGHPIPSNQVSIRRGDSAPEQQGR